MMADLKQKKAEFDREMSYRQQKMQDDLLERERLKEADFLQKQIHLEEKYQQVCLNNFYFCGVLSINCFN